MKEQGVKQVFLMSDLVILAVIFIAGVALLFAGHGLVGVGVTAILCGVLMLPFFRHGYKLDGHKGVYRKKELLMSRECKKDVIAFLDGTSEVLDLHPRVQGGALVDLYYQKGAGGTVARYFDYEDYSNGTEYPLRELTPERAKMFLPYF